MKKTLVLDNYDSFVHNLVHYLEQEDVEVDVLRNDRVSIDEVLRYERILLSPGPGIPKDAGIMPELLKRLTSSHKVLGVCLGHQGLVEAFGGSLKNLDRVIHGESTLAVQEEACPLFEGLPPRFSIGHYHSWVADGASLPKAFKVTLRDEDGELMGVAHRERPYYGVQFHPESVLTEHGHRMVRNWINGSSVPS